VSERISASASRAATDVRVVFGRVKRRLNALARTDDLTPSQSSMLSRLDKDGPASASELAAAERIRPQSVASILAALREAGLIERRPDPNDGRRQVVSLTTAGRQRLQGDRKVRQEWLAASLQEHCTEAERQTIIEALALLDHALEAATER
jgi:DNA-binding MarR family transcriptional regulator